MFGFWACGTADCSVSRFYGTDVPLRCLTISWLIHLFIEEEAIGLSGDKNPASDPVTHCRCLASHTFNTEVLPVSWEGLFPLD